jgi:outer membrane immunogenic protein
MGSSETIVTEESTMKKLLLAAAAALVVATPTFAGDLPVRRTSPYYGPTQAAAPLFNWTGFYIGGNAGWGWGSAFGLDPSGYLLGLQAGYNFQLAGAFLAGIETDISFTGIDDKGGGAKFAVDYLGTVRGRLGYAVDRVMFFGAGGLAYGRGDLEVANLSNKQTQYGWTIGAGVETMIAPNVTARLEYLYANLGTDTYAIAVAPGTARVSYDTSIVRMGMNYKF